MSYTLVHDAAEVVIGPAGDTSDGTLHVESDGAVVVEDGTVSAVGPSAEITADYPVANAETVVDANGKCVLPGFVDAHTHALFVGDRSDEFEAKLAGKSYQDILAEGGGILRTVRNVRDATDVELADQLRAHLDVMLAHGTTTAEVKSGYGLDTETELGMLAVIDEVNDSHPIDLVPTFMGAHAIPDDSTSEEYTKRVVTEQIPAVADQGIAQFCDVFCEADVFSVEQSRRILTAGAERSLVPKIHADEFVRLGGSELAADLSAASADHLLQSTAEDAAQLVDNDVTPVFLPGTAFGLDGEYPSLAPFRDRGTVPAIATDFNPNCYAPTLGFAATLACVGIGMTPAESVLGITERGANALHRTDGHGTLRTGAPGDLAVLDAPSYRHLPYNYDVNIVETVVKDGTIVRSPAHP
jgi:imidazolonepropionase